MFKTGESYMLSCPAVVNAISPVSAICQRKVNSYRKVCSLLWVFMLNVCESFHILFNLSSSTHEDKRKLCPKLMSAIYSYIAERNLGIFFPQ